MKTNWKSKLTSRKFWAAVVGFLTALLAAFHMDEMTIQQVTALVTAGGVLVAYILGEGMVDKARINTDSKPQDPPSFEEKASDQTAGQQDQVTKKGE